MIYIVPQCKSLILLILIEFQHENCSIVKVYEETTLLVLSYWAVQPQSTYIYRVPQCKSPRRNWDSPTPSLASECAPAPLYGVPKGGGGAHSAAAEGFGVPIPTTGEKA